MRFLFYDIECSNCINGIGKMCEFGYVLTDEKFNIIYEDDIPMSPGKGRINRFNLNGRGISLAYDVEFYYDQPEFPEFYNKIKRLLTMENTICIGFSVGNDVNYIINSCNRYDLSTVNYDSYDIQVMANKYLESSTDVSLKDACSKIAGTQAYVQAQEHLAKDDAKMTMKVFEALCMFWKTDSMSLLKEYQSRKINSLKREKQLIESHFKKKQRIECYDIYEKACNKDKLLDEFNNANKYTFSYKVKIDVNEMTLLINKIHEIGGVLTFTIDNANYIVARNEEDKQRMLNGFKRPYEGEFIFIENLLRK